jgi:FkbH-like protein
MTIIPFKDLKKNLKKDVSSFPRIKIALLGDSATQFLSVAIRGIGVEYGYNIDLFEAEFNQIEQQFLDQSSDLYAFKADYIVVFQSTHKLLSKYNQLPIEKQSLLADERLGFIRLICNSVSSRLIYFNYPEIDDNVFGSYANKVEGSFSFQVRKLNYELMRLAIQKPNFLVCDISALQNKHGRDKMFDSSIHVSTEMVFCLDSIPYVASRIMDIIFASYGKFKKCLILDLDNTVWGGVIGDDGWENIQIGHGLGIGKAFSEFQHWVKKLKERGIIIAICSKNNENIAKEPFVRHPEMVLRLDDIAVFIANWDNKADNIRQIQFILNIGFDSMVFLDDNPFERSMVRENIPEITVPELPEDPAEYLEYLYGLNLFETVSYNSVDADRTKQYQIVVQHVAMQKSFADEKGFLKSLNMVSEVSPFNSFNVPRVAQLSQRSNQFNLRTIRYFEADIEKMSKDEYFQCFSFTLDDKFGENGLIGVVILEKQDIETLFINTWLMSCRVLKRGMENFTLNTIVKYAGKNGFKKIVGEYIRTSKNKIVADHYLNLGFSLLDNTEQNLFLLNIDTYKERECYIIEKSSF